MWSLKGHARPLRTRLSHRPVTSTINLLWCSARRNVLVLLITPLKHFKIDILRQKRIKFLQPGDWVQMAQLTQEHASGPTSQMLKLPSMRSLETLNSSWSVLFGAMMGTQWAIWSTDSKMSMMGSQPLTATIDSRNGMKASSQWREESSLEPAWSWL